MTRPNQKQKSATQDFVDIEEIREGVTILKDGTLRGILMCSSMNFELKSQEEQEAIIAAYQGFLNSFDWSIQIVIHSRRLDINPYLTLLEEKLKTQENELLKIQTAEYIEFIRSLVGLENIMTKSFFLVIPFDPTESKTAGVEEKLGGLFKKAAKTAPIVLSQERFNEYKTQLVQRQEHIILGLSRFGIQALPLQTEELIELFYNLYNPEEIESKDLRISQATGIQ